MIPLAAVQRVELLTDGASAIYGADAVAGVANFILRRDYVGFETAVRGSLATSGGAENFGADQTAGLAWGSGNLLASYSFNRDGPLRTSERSYVNSPSASTGDFDLLPRQTQHNALLHLRQDIGPNVEISADSLYGYRRFRAISNTASVDGITTDERGRTQQYSVSGNIKVNLSDWQFVIDSNYSNVDQNFVETFLADYLPPEGSLFTVLTNTNLLEFDARAEGPVAHLPGGAARLAVGGSYRRETFVDHIDADGFTVLEVNSRRHLYSVFAEFHAPIIGGDSGMPSLRRLEVTAAGRYDSYSDFGSSWNPKVGVLWAPTRDVVFRSTFARSFRAPALQQLSEANRQYGLFPIPDPTAPDGVTNTLVTLAIGNSSLGPERSNSFTAGTDITFRALDNLRLSITFFNIDYRGRIGNPPVIGSLFNIFQQEDTLAPYIKRSPDPAEIARIFATELVLSGGVFPVTPDKVEAQFDNRPQNIASSRFRGLDFLLSYSKNMSVGTISATANVAYIATLNFRPAAGVPVVDLVDTIYNPPRWRARATMDWQRRSIGAGLNISYVDSYANNLITPAGEVPSWTTVGAHLAYTIGSARGRGLDIFFSVENLLNQRPPRVTGTITPFFNIGYDPTNASALGRVLALSVVKRW
jgi:outer membrane receptor protein involved in Fe transport